MYQESQSYLSWYRSFEGATVQNIQSLKKKRKISDYSANNPTCVLNVIIAALGESLFIYTL